MSHIVTIEAEVRAPTAVAAACRRLGLPQPAYGTARLFAAEADGLLVRLPGWLYPVVAQVESGRLLYDHFEGAWGDPALLGRFLQAYAVERAKIVARSQGHTAVEHALADGSIRLTITVGGTS